MIGIPETDFIPLSEFSLRWRFNNPRYSVLAAADLASMRPLGRSRSALLAMEATARCASRGGAAWDHVILADADAAPHVRDRLLRLDIAPDLDVVLSWDTATALVSTWKVVVDHWSDFCYPGSDDVTIWSPSAPWTLCYRHFEIFEFTSLRTRVA